VLARFILGVHDFVFAPCCAVGYKSSVVYFFRMGITFLENSQFQKDRKATVVAVALSSYNLPTDRARELFKPSSDTGSLLVQILKIFLSFSVLGS